MIELDGSVAVVTGGAGGIGRALTQRLAAEGARVAVVDLDEAAATSAAAAVTGARGYAADVGDPTAVTAMVERVESELGPVTLYCSNAGLITEGGLGGDGAWETSWKVHGMAHVYAARAVLPGMAERGSGALVITASAAGLLMSMESAVYTVTKHASVAIAEWLAVHNAHDGVQVHCLCPQGVRTAMVSADPHAEAEVAAAGAIIPPEQVAEAVLAAVRDNRFLVLPHPEVHDYEKFKVEDRDRWLGGMRRLYGRLRAG